MRRISRLEPAGDPSEKLDDINFTAAWLIELN
jgi:hypothetical protein